jgi:hypothetical protein
MVRSVALGFGVVTALALAGSMTPKGQAMLGLSHPAAEQSAPVTVIQDKPAPVPAPVQSVAPAPTGPAPRIGAPRPVPSAPPQPQTRPAGPIAQHPSAGPSLPQQGGPGGLAGVANILLNLPQVLDQTRGGPARGSDSWSESGTSDSKPVRFHKNHASGGDHGKDSGDSTH